MHFYKEDAKENESYSILVLLIITNKYFEIKKCLYPGKLAEELRNINSKFFLPFMRTC